MFKKLVLASALFAGSIMVDGEQKNRIDELMDALIIVESNGNDNAVGDNGRALGCLQIWKVVVDDVNRVSKKKYTHADAYDRRKAREICEIYLRHYGNHAAKNGVNVTDEVLARIWNGGPKGYIKDSTKPYWKKVQAVLNYEKRRR